MVRVYDKDTPPKTISLRIRANAVEPVSCQHGPKVQTPLSCYCSWPHLLWKKSVCQTPVWIWRRSNRRSSLKYHLVLSDIPIGLRWDAKDYSQHHVRQRSSWWFRIHDKPNHSDLVVIDDWMQELRNDQRINNLFTKGCHHRNLSVIFILQNIFHRGKGLRDMSLNYHYLVMFKSPRDSSQVSHLAKQMFPGHVKYTQEAFQDATKRPYGYLLCDP